MFRESGLLPLMSRRVAHLARNERAFAQLRVQIACVRVSGRLARIAAGLDWNSVVR